MKKANLDSVRSAKGEGLIYFGGLAIITTCVAVDPLALRPRLSPSLPLSTTYYNIIVKGFLSFDLTSMKYRVAVL
jgi:hypothetical protein